MKDVQQIYGDIQFQVRSQGGNKVFGLYAALYHWDERVWTKSAIYKKVMALAYNSSNFCKEIISDKDLADIEKICDRFNVVIAPTPSIEVFRIKKNSDGSGDVYTQTFYMKEALKFEWFLKLISKNPNDMFHVYTVEKGRYRFVQVEGEAKEKIPVYALRKEKLSRIKQLE